MLSFTLFLEVFDQNLLVSAHPAGDGDQEELELSRHKVENLSKIPAAQSSRWSRLSFLAVHASSQRQGVCSVDAEDHH
jgi:hypothetical protein